MSEAERVIELRREKLRDFLYAVHQHTTREEFKDIVKDIVKDILRLG